MTVKKPKSGILFILWLLWCLIAPGCANTLSDEDRAIAREDREYAQRQRKAQAAVCRAAGGVYLEDGRYSRPQCVSRESLMRELRRLGVYR